MNRRRFHLALLALAGLPLLPAHAAGIDMLRRTLPSADARTPVLTVTAAGKRTVLTLADLEKLPLRQTTLKTGWGDTGTYQGILLTDLLRRHGLENAPRLTFKALDNYRSVLTPAQWQASPALIATRFNGQPIPVAAKGPLIVLWPEKEQQALAGGTALDGWVWMLTGIDAP